MRGGNVPFDIFAGFAFGAQHWARPAQSGDKLALLNQKVAIFHSNEDERDLLQELSQLAQVEHYRSAANYRLGGGGGLSRSGQ